MLYSQKKAGISRAYYFRGWCGCGSIKNQGNAELAHPKNIARLVGLLRPDRVL